MMPWEEAQQNSSDSKPPWEEAQQSTPQELGQKDQSTFDKINNSFPGVRRGLQIGLDTLNAPFEVVGEAARQAVSGGQFRLPTVASDLGINADNRYLTTQQPPMNMFSLPRKAIEAGIQGARALPQGIGPAAQAASNEFSRTSINPVEGITDLGTALGTSFAAPQIANAPLQVIENAGSKIAGSAKSLFKSTAPKVMSSVFGPSPEAITARAQNPEAIKNYTPYPDMAQDLAGTMNDIGGQIKTETNQAWDSLLRLKAEPRDTVVKMLNNLKTDLRVTGGGPLGAENQKAYREIDRFIEGLKGINQKGVKPEMAQMMDQRQLKQVIDAADSMADWNNTNPDATASSFRQFRGKLNEYLRTQNPQYAEIMDPISQKMDLVNNISKSFQLRRDAGYGNQLVPSDITPGKFPSMLDEKRLRTRDYLGELEGLTGKDYLGEAQNAKHGMQFQPGATKANGSRRTIGGSMLGTTVGAGIGALTGHPGIGAGIGNALGTVSGMYLDSQGGAIAGKIIDAFSKGSGGLVSKYAPLLIQAVNQGAPSVSAASEELMKSDPDYKKWIIDILATKQVEPLFQSAPESKPLFKKAVNQSAAPQDEDSKMAFKSLMEGPKDVAWTVTQPSKSDYKPFDPQIPERKAKVISPSSIAATRAEVPQPKKYLDEKTARQYLKQADGDKQMARQMATQDGWTVV